jgi:integrase/recombinase XerD
MREHRGLTDATLDVYEGILTELPDALGDDVRLYSAEALRAFVFNRARPRHLSC